MRSTVCRKYLQLPIEFMNQLKLRYVVSTLIVVILTRISEESRILRSVDETEQLYLFLNESSEIDCSGGSVWALSNNIAITKVNGPLSNANRPQLDPNYQQSSLFSLNLKNWNYSANGIHGNFILVVLSMQSALDNLTLVCQSGLTNRRESITLILASVRQPLLKVSISFHNHSYDWTTGTSVSAFENDRMILTCNASLGSVPSARVQLRWQYSSGLLDNASAADWTSRRSENVSRMWDGTRIWCEAQNDLGRRNSRPAENSTAVLLTVYYVDRVFIAIDDVMVNSTDAVPIRENSSPRLRCLGTCNPECKYHWTCQLQEENGSISWENETIAIDSINRSYIHCECRVELSLRNRTENATEKVKLNITYAPEIRITSSLTGQSGEALWAWDNGSLVTLNCTVITSNPAVEQVFWMKNGRQLLDETSWQLGITANPQSSGDYTCSAQNSVGVGNASVQLIIIFGPFWNESASQNQSCHMGESCTLTCNIVAFPNNLTYQWWRSDGSIFESTDRILMPTILNSSDLGEYMCRASNGLNSINVTLILQLAVTLHDCKMNLSRDGLELEVHCETDTIDRIDDASMKIRFEMSVNGTFLSQNESDVAGVEFSIPFKGNGNYSVAVAVHNQYGWSEWTRWWQWVGREQDPSPSVETISTTKASGAHTSSTVRITTKSDTTVAQQKWWIYVIAAGCCVVVLIGVIITVTVIRKKKRNKLSQKSDQEKLKSPADSEGTIPALAYSEFAGIGSGSMVMSTLDSSVPHLQNEDAAVYAHVPKTKGKTSKGTADIYARPEKLKVSDEVYAKVEVKKKKNEKVVKVKPAKAKKKGPDPVYSNAIPGDKHS